MNWWIRNTPRLQEAAARLLPKVGHQTFKIGNQTFKVGNKTCKARLDTRPWKQDLQGKVGHQAFKVGYQTWNCDTGPQGWIPDLQDSPPGPEGWIPDLQGWTPDVKGILSERRVVLKKWNAHIVFFYFAINIIFLQLIIIFAVNLIS